MSESGRSQSVFVKGFGSQVLPVFCLSVCPRARYSALSLSAWAKENRLKLNAGKTKAIAFSSGRWVRGIPELEFEGVVVHYVDSVNNLGLTLESRLGWECHGGKVINTTKLNC